MSGLIQKVDVPEQTTPETPIAPAWYLDEGIPGAGDRPEWLEPKYNKVSDQAKAYKEAERKLGAQIAPAPEDYILDDYKDLFEIESPHILDLKNKAKELRLSQDAFKSLVDPFANYHKSLMPDKDKEIAKLGPYADMKINTVNTWASNHLSDKSLETLGVISHTADVFNLMDEIRQLHSQTVSKVPTTVQPSGPVSLLSPETVQQEIVDNYSRYQTDAGYRAQLTQKMKMACGEE